MSSTAGDFRNLTPLVLMARAADGRARRCTSRCTGSDSRSRPTAFGAVLPVAGPRCGPCHATPTARGTSYLLEGEIPAARVHELEQRLPALTRGEGVLECAFDHYQPVSGTVPTRPRTDHNPLNRQEYLLQVVRRVSAPGDSRC